MGSGRGRSRRAQAKTLRPPVVAKTSFSHLPVFANVLGAESGEPGVVFGAALDGPGVKYDVVWASGDVDHGISPEGIVADSEGSTKPYTGADYLGKTVIFRDLESNKSGTGGLEDFYGQRARIAKVRTGALSEALAGRCDPSELMYELMFSDNRPLRWLARDDFELLEDRLADRLQDVKVDTSEPILF